VSARVHVHNSRRRTREQGTQGLRKRDRSEKVECEGRLVPFRGLFAPREDTPDVVHEQVETVEATAEALCKLVGAEYSVSPANQAVQHDSAGGAAWARAIARAAVQTPWGGAWLTAGPRCSV
jgi:hypothetical protein